MSGISISYPMDVPRGPLNQIGRRLETSGCVIPGFQPPDIGLLHGDALVYAQKAEGLNYTLLIDRNIVSRVAKVARESRVSIRDVPTTPANFHNTSVPAPGMVSRRVNPGCEKPRGALNRLRHVRPDVVDLSLSTASGTRRTVA